MDELDPPGRAGTEAAHQDISADEDLSADEGALRREPRADSPMNFKRGPRLRGGVRRLPGCASTTACDRLADVDGRGREPRRFERVAPLAYGVRVAETRGRDRRARRSHRATRARRCNLPAFSSPRRGADEYPDTRCD
ncbi:MAG: hypothetical protein DME05_15630 [Candidatus Rokuibacteriota bacterium]|nr:MAG: hypothetical protein DME05_15630 [Candidatus Rokubacteria bacterium]